MQFTCKLKVILLLNLQILLSIVNSLAVNLSRSSEISLLTCSSGDELYSTFGHSAVLVRDDSLLLNLVFNYGTFDFDTPNFYLKFINGDLNYMLSVTEYPRFQRSYAREGRRVVKHVLRLNLEEKQAIWDFLSVNIQPENRFYRYDFFFDNCATRIRDVVFDLKNIDKSEFTNTNGSTFRDYLHTCASLSTWSSQGVDLVLGIRSDYQATNYDRAFVPAYLDSLFFEADLIEKSTELLPQKSVNSLFPFIYRPFQASIWLLIIAVLITLLERRFNRHFKVFDVILFLAAFVVSFLLWYLWLFTKHYVCGVNINILWASILYLPIVVMLFVKKAAKPMRILCQLNCLFLVVFVLLSIFGVQYPPTMTYPIAATLFLRNMLIVRSR